MPIKSTMQASFGKLFDTAFAEAVKPFTGTYTSGGRWDPVNEVLVGGGTVTYTSRGVFTRFQNDQIDGLRILATDVRLIVLANEIASPPMPGHRITGPDLVTGESREYEVMPVRPDPIGVHYQIQLRAT